MPDAIAPYLTADVPPLGGRLRERPEDFLVEEQPLYQPSGSGEHIYLFVEKKKLSTTEMVHTLARHFNVRRQDIGYAGMKDKMAITRQVISIHTPKKTFEDFPMIQNDRISVLWADMHTNKLRLGHLAGNRFSIRIRGVRMTQVLQARKVMQRMETEGVPNLAGEQRFGNRLNNHRLGRAMIRRDWKGVLDEMLGPDAHFPEVNTEARRLYEAGEYSPALDAFPTACRHERAALHTLEKGGTPERAVKTVDITQRRFWFTAFQSAVFNDILRARLSAGTFGGLVEGDVACKMENGAMFAVDETALADPALPGRLERFEVSATGPIWGAKMMRAAGAIDEAEVIALREGGAEPADLDEAVRQLGPSMSGARRAFRVRLKDPEIEGGIDEHGEYVRCAFELPPGAFATVVMREIMKNDHPGVPEEEAAA